MPIRILKRFLQSHHFTTHTTISQHIHSLASISIMRVAIGVMTKLVLGYFDRRGTNIFSESQEVKLDHNCLLLSSHYFSMDKTGF